MSVLGLVVCATVEWRRRCPFNFQSEELYPWDPCRPCVGNYPQLRLVVGAGPTRTL